MGTTEDGLCSPLTTTEDHFEAADEICEDVEEKNVTLIEQIITDLSEITTRELVQQAKELKVLYMDPGLCPDEHKEILLRKDNVPRDLGGVLIQLAKKEYQNRPGLEWRLSVRQDWRSREKYWIP